MGNHRTLFQMLDKEGLGMVTLDDVSFLNRWQLPAFLFCDPNVETSLAVGTPIFSTQPGAPKVRKSYGAYSKSPSTKSKQKISVLNRSAQASKVLDSPLVQDSLSWSPATARESLASR